MNSSRKKLQVWFSAKNFLTISVVIHLLKTIVIRLATMKYSVNQTHDFICTAFQITSLKARISLQVAMHSIRALVKQP